MPTYQYACTECGHQFETVQSFSDDALTDCPECTGRLRKVFNAVGIVFKGSGFYRTDSRKSAAGGSASSTSSETKSESKSDTKTGSAGSAGSESKPKTSSTAGSGSAGSSSSTAGTAA